MPSFNDLFSEHCFIFSKVLVLKGIYIFTSLHGWSVHLNFPFLFAGKKSCTYLVHWKDTGSGRWLFWSPCVHHPNILRVRWWQASQEACAKPLETTSHGVQVGTEDASSKWTCSICLFLKVIDETFCGRTNVLRPQSFPRTWIHLITLPWY